MLVVVLKNKKDFEKKLIEAFKQAKKAETNHIVFLTHVDFNDEMNEHLISHPAVDRLVVDGKVLYMCKDIRFELQKIHLYL
jgi:hypothetical protein